MHLVLLKVVGAIAAAWFSLVPPVRQVTDLDLTKELLRQTPEVTPRVLSLAIKAASCEQHRTNHPPRYLAVIDYSLASTRKRFWLFDLHHRRLVAEELIAHGKGSGLDRATRFSNVAESRQSSLGLFKAGLTYNGKHGYSLYLHGLEQGVNDNAFSRGIVMHGASYVSREFAARWKRLGRSWGCPALSEKAAPAVIDYLKDGGLVFAYYPDKSWLERSEHLNGCGRT